LSLSHWELYTASSPLVIITSMLSFEVRLKEEEVEGVEGELGLLFSLPVATGALNHADQIH